MKASSSIAAAFLAFGTLAAAIPTPQGTWPRVDALGYAGPAQDATRVALPIGTTIPGATTSGSGTGSSTDSRPGNASVAPVQAKQYDCTFAKSGLPSAFPDKSTWLSGKQLWTLHLEETKTANKETFPDEASMQQGLAAMEEALIKFPWTLGIPEIQDIPDGIFVARASQESTIRANPPCTNAGTTNCGILQGPQGSRTFDKSDMQTSLHNVVEDAIKGKNDSGGGYMDGYLAALQKATKELGATSVTEAVAIAERLYNSGMNSLAKRNALNLNAGTAASTASYVSDMANLLTGWVNDGQHGSYKDCAAA